MTAQDLKNSILQRAMQGKLVEQRADEGTAAELLIKIKAEKDRLIKEGKIKKEKPLPEISEDEIPFDIPDSWEWVRLGNISTYAQTKRKISPSDITDDMWSLDLEDIEKDTGKILEYKCAKERKITGDKVRFCKGNILYSKLRPYLLKILIADNDGICTPEIVPFDVFCNIVAKYIVYMLKTPYANFTVNAVSYGVKMPRVGTETMINLLVPLPPLAEQKRIVAKIEELMPLVEQYGKAYDKLTQLNNKFPEDMRKSILQYAMQGKLVEQRAEEGTAEELLKQIRTEKDRLIKEGKINKEKPLPEITDEEKPFDIPDSWEWVRLNDIVSKNIKRGKSPQYVDQSSVQVFAQKCNVKTGGINMDIALFLDEEKAKSYPELEYMQHNDIVINSTGGGTMGRIGIFSDADRKNNMSVVPDSHITVVRANCNMDAMYLYYILKNYQKYLESMGEGSTNQTELKPVVIMQLLIPLPPLAEQHRIVEAIENLMPYCRQLSK